METIGVGFDLLVVEFLANRLLPDTWGFADLQHSVRALNDYIRYSGWTGVGVIDGDWIIAGHSNGGKYGYYFGLILESN